MIANNRDSEVISAINAESGGIVFVYCITNKVTKKKYIGATKRSLNKRLGYKNWCWQLFSNSSLKNDIKKLGRSGFTLRVLKRPKTKESLAKWESFYIDKYRTLSPEGYNLQSGGRLGMRVHEETRAKISKTMKKSFLPHRGIFLKREAHPCKMCGKEILSYANRGEFKKTCSDKCYRKNASINMASRWQGGKLE